MHDISGRFLAQEKYFGFGRKLADSSSGFDSIQRRKSYVEHDQVRLQFFRFLNRFQSVRDLADDLQLRLFPQRRAHKSAKLFVVLYDENADW